MLTNEALNLTIARRGRYTGGMRKTPEVVPIRLTAAEKETVKRTAADRGLSVSTYVRRLILRDLVTTEKETTPP